MHAIQLLHHNGGAPGVSAGITIPVFDGVGVVALANADQKQLVLDDITLIVLRKLAGYTDESMLANIVAHPSTRFRSATSGARRSREGGPSATNDLPLNRLNLTGTYDDVGYGTLTLYDASSWSDECRPVLDDFSFADEPSMSDPNRLFGSWPCATTSHARFNPTNTPGRYLVEFGTLYPTGYGRNTTPFAHWMAHVTADFVVEDGIVKGFGFSGIGEREGYESVEENFDVWFSKRVTSGLVVRSAIHSKVSCHHSEFSDANDS